MTQKEKMHKQMLYLPNDKQIMAEQALRLDMLYDYNATRPTETEKREKLLKEMFCELGEGCYIEPPLRANWAGKFCKLGKNVYANFNLTLVDDTEINIGDNTMIAPNVTITTATHPVLPELREKAYQYNMPVHIGKNCWLGAGVIVLPGVTIGDNSVIGAGSLVNKDIPPDVVAVGTPCKVLRKINDNDKEFYAKGKRIDWSDIIR